MTDPRAELDELVGRWLVLIVNLRAQSAALHALEYDLRHRAGTNEDAALAALLDALQTKCDDADVMLATMTDDVKRLRTRCASLGAAYVEALVDHARAAAPD